MLSQTSLALTSAACPEEEQHCPLWHVVSLLTQPCYSSAISVSWCTTTLVTDMSGCCSFAAFMAWARTCKRAHLRQGPEGARGNKSLFLTLGRKKGKQSRLAAVWKEAWFKGKAGINGAHYTQQRIPMSWRLLIPTGARWRGAGITGPFRICTQYLAMSSTQRKCARFWELGRAQLSVALGYLLKARWFSKNKSHLSAAPVRRRIGAIKQTLFILPASMTSKLQTFSGICCQN